MNLIYPRLDVLPPAQQLLWPRLHEIGSDFILYGGTAIALQLGGRKSVDFDFFTDGDVNPADLHARYSFLDGATLLQRAKATATFSLGVPDPVKVSFFGTLDFGRVDEPSMFVDTGVHVAGLLDLAVQKVKVVQQRADKKDYIDICSLLRHGIPLPSMLAGAMALFPEFNPMVTLKALTYFEDGDLRSLPGEDRDLLISVVSRIKEIPTLPKTHSSIRSRNTIKHDSADI